MAVTQTAPPAEDEDQAGPEAPTLFERVWRWRVALVVAGAFFVALLLAYRGRPSVLYDDAAITMRYAWRMGHGFGWTYNDLDRTNGASAPLYTMVLAVLGLGLDLPSAARWLGILTYATSVAMATYLAERIAGLIAAVLAAIFLLTWGDFLSQSLSGMESSLAVVLGLAVIIALREQRDGWAGVLIGLALINKLDAGMLAVAVAVAYLVVLRKPPWRVMGAAIVVFTPWMLIATAYFGSVIPFSFTQKASSQVDNPMANQSRTWILEALRDQKVIPLLLLALAATAAVVWLARSVPRAALALGVCVVWPIFHGLVFSLLKLGDRYPWYLTALYAPLAIAASCAIAVAVNAVKGWWRVGAAVIAVAVVAVSLGTVDRPGGRVRNVADTIVNGNSGTDFDKVESTRRDAAKYLATIIEPGEVIATCFGWFAYESRTNPILETCPLNTRLPVDPPRYGTALVMPSNVEPDIPSTARIVATFISDTDPATQPSMRVDIIEYDFEARAAEREAAGG